MTDFNKPRPTPEDEAFNDIERQAQQRKESVKAAIAQTDYGLLEHKLAVYEAQKRNQTIEEVALHVEKLKGFGQDTISSLAIYIREMKK